MKLRLFYGMWNSSFLGWVKSAFINGSKPLTMSVVGRGGGGPTPQVS